MTYVRRLLDGDIRALARAISLVEEDSPKAVDVLREVYPHTGSSRVLGVTGSPGSGKSTLVDRLVSAFRSNGDRVGVIAVDPSSAFSGGAILGDRIRMQDHANDPGVYIRSMATRGHLGGLARAANDVIDLLDGAGYDPILVETVGVGQDEVDIVRTADAVGVVLVPGMGDDIQAIKAGILEIADVFVINKADREGTDRLHADLDYMLSLAGSDDASKPPIYRTVAVRDEGISELAEGMLAFLARQGDRRRKARRRERAEARFLALLSERILARVRADAFPGKTFDETIDRIAEREVDPYSAARQVLDRLEVG